MSKIKIDVTIEEAIDGLLQVSSSLTRSRGGNAAIQALIDDIKIDCTTRKEFQRLSTYDQILIRKYATQARRVLMAINEQSV